MGKRETQKSRGDKSSETEGGRGIPRSREGTGRRGKKYTLHPSTKEGGKPRKVRGKRNTRRDGILEDEIADKEF